MQYVTSFFYNISKNTPEIIEKNLLEFYPEMKELIEEIKIKTPKVIKRLEEEKERLEEEKNKPRLHKTQKEKNVRKNK